MSNIEENLAFILSSRYGKDVRQAIHDAIHDCYEDGKAGAVDLIAREQIANLVANAGDGSKDSELVNIRVGYNGTEYPSAGEAVRGQIGSLSEDIYYFSADNRRLYITFERGAIDGSGSKVEHQTAIRLWEYEFDKPTTLYTKDKLIRVNIYIENELVYEKSSTTYNARFKFVTGQKYRISIGKSGFELPLLPLDDICFIQENDIPYLKKHILDFSEKIILDWTKGYIDVTSEGLKFNPTEFKGCYVPYSFKFVDGYLIIKTKNGQKVGIVETDENRKIINNYTQKEFQIINVVKDNIYWFRYWANDHSYYVNNDDVEVVFTKKVAISEIALNFLHNSSCDGAGNTVVSHNGSAVTEKIYTKDNKIYLFTFPYGYKVKFNNQRSDDIRLNSNDEILPFSFTNYSDFIRFIIYKKESETEIPTQILDNCHLYEIEKGSEYDARITKTSNDLRNYIRIDNYDEQDILQGLINCYDSLSLFIDEGEYILSRIHKTRISGQNAFISTNENSYDYKTLTIKGKSPSRLGYGGTIVKFEYNADSLNENEENSGFLIPRRGKELDNNQYSYVAIFMKDVSFLGFGYTKPIVYLDFTHSMANGLKNINVRCDGKYSGVDPFETTPNIECVGIRCGYGSNNGIQNYIKNSCVLYSGIGTSICGEHYILEDVLSHHCYYGFAFGDRLTRGNYEHPNIMIGCSIEGCYRLMYLSKYGETEESTVENAKNTLICEGLSTETRWDIPLDDERAGESETTKPIYEVIKGMYRGRIEGDYRGKNISIFEDDESGKNMIQTTY